MQNGKKSSSRERMLTALKNKHSDYIPCSFMFFGAPRKKSKDQFEAIEEELDLGLDVRVELPELPFRFHPNVKVKEWKEKSEGGYLLHKEYYTPTGKLTATVKKTKDWPYGDSVPLFDDWLTPRSCKFLVEKRENLEAFRYLLAEPTADDIAVFHEQARTHKRFAADKGLVVSGGWENFGLKKGIDWNGGTMGADALFWLCGVERVLLLAMDEPEMIEELLQMISQWNMRRMEVYLDEGIDLLIKRAWYESADFWSLLCIVNSYFLYSKKRLNIPIRPGQNLAMS